MVYFLSKSDLRLPKEINVIFKTRTKHAREDTIRANNFWSTYLDIVLNSTINSIL